MDFPIANLMDEDACYTALVAWLHPGGFACHRCHRPDKILAHRRHRAPVLDHRCGHCGRVFNAFTATVLHGIRRRPSELILILRGFAQGVPTAQLARELDRDRTEVLALRHRLQERAFAGRDRTPLDDDVRCATPMASGRGMTTGTGSGRWIATPWRGCGRGCGIICGYFEA